MFRCIIVHFVLDWLYGEVCIIMSNILMGVDRRDKVEYFPIPSLFECDDDDGARAVQLAFITADCVGTAAGRGGVGSDDDTNTASIRLCFVQFLGKHRLVHRVSDVPSSGLLLLLLIKQNSIHQTETDFVNIWVTKKEIFFSQSPRNIAESDAFALSCH